MTGRRQASGATGRPGDPDPDPPARRSAGTAAAANAAPPRRPHGRWFQCRQGKVRSASRHTSVIVSDEPKVPDKVGAQVGTRWEKSGSLVGPAPITSQSKRTPATPVPALVDSEPVAAVADSLGCCGRNRHVSSLCYCSISKLLWLSATESLATKGTSVVPEKCIIIWYRNSIER